LVDQFLTEIKQRRRALSGRARSGNGSVADFFDDVPDADEVVFVLFVHGQPTCGGRPVPDTRLDLGLRSVDVHGLRERLIVVRRL